LNRERRLSLGGGFAVALLAAFAASWLSVWLNDLLLWMRRESARR